MLEKIFKSDYLIGIFVIFGGIFLTKLMLLLFKKTIFKSLSEDLKSIGEKLSLYVISFIIIIYSLKFFGIDFKVLLGAAGIITVAIGFAARTSTSNLISGLFLLFEKPFSVGDLIEIDGEEGLILSIDLLSTKLRKFNNTLIRIPNETMMKSKILNHTYFPIRRVDIFITLDKDQDLDEIQDSLLYLAETNTLCLDEPKAIFLVEKWVEQGIKVQFSFWVLKDDYYEATRSMHVDIINEFKKLKISLPYSKLEILKHKPNNSDKNDQAFS